MFKMEVRMFKKVMLVVLLATMNTVRPSGDVGKAFTELAYKSPGSAAVVLGGAAVGAGALWAVSSVAGFIKRGLTPQTVANNILSKVTAQNAEWNVLYNAGDTLYQCITDQNKRLNLQENRAVVIQNRDIDVDSIKAILIAIRGYLDNNKKRYWIFATTKYLGEGAINDTQVLKEFLPMTETGLLALENSRAQLQGYLDSYASYVRSSDTINTIRYVINEINQRIQAAKFFRMLVQLQPVQNVLRT